MQMQNMQKKTGQVCVIIPVYNHFNYTKQCLESLFSHESKYTFDIIVMDDCSTDETEKELSVKDGIRYVRNKENLGFLKNCNKAARFSESEFLVFLNNDTIVKEKWLDSLIDTLKRDSSVGLVGSKLIYPDGRLQEAGGIIFSDGRAWNYGRLCDPNDPTFNYTREVDYCSGASIAIRRDLFMNLGLFDERYAPAYAEDSDLCLKVKEAKLKVVYQCASEVIHFEGVSSGTDLSKGVKSYQTINVKKLYEKWSHQLKNNGLPEHHPHLCRDKGVEKRLLLIDAVTPNAAMDSGSVNTLNYIKLFQAHGFKVSFYAFNKPFYVEEHTAHLQQMGVEVFYRPYYQNIEEVLAFEGYAYDQILLVRHYIASQCLAQIKLYAPQAKVLFHNSDFHYLRELRQAKISEKLSDYISAELTKKSEFSVMSSVDVVIVHTIFEKDLLKEIFPGITVEVYPWTIEVVEKKSSFEKRKGIVFLGGYAHPPNVDAVIYFAKEILPLVIEENPEIVFYAVGSKAPKELYQYEGDNLKIIGFVENLEECFEQFRVAISPLRYGAGIKGKVATYMANGLPSVITPISAEGMGLVHEKEVLISSNEKDFARAIARLYEDEGLWNTLEKSGKEFIDNHYSFRIGKEIIGSVLQKSKESELRVYG